MLHIEARTNREYCMINTLIATMPDGRRYVFDRDETRYDFHKDETTGDIILVMNWYCVYLWEADDIHIDGYEPFYIDVESDFFKDIFERAKLSFELEDDADEQYRVTDIALYC